MFGWAKRAKQLWPKCEIHEIHGQSMEVRLDGELLVDAKKNAFGQMLCNQKESHAKHSLGQLVDPSWKPEEK